MKQDNSLDRLVVQSDPTYTANKRFEGVFGHGEYVLVLVEADDPFAPDVLRRFDELELDVGQVPRVTANSALSIFARAKGGFDGTPEEVAQVQGVRHRHQSLQEAGAVGRRTCWRCRSSSTCRPPSARTR